MGLNLGALTVLLEGDTAEFRKNMEGVASTMSGIGAKVAAVGLKMAASMGTALAGVAVASGKMAMDFEKDMANVGTLLGSDGAERVKELGKDVKKLAGITGKPLDDLANGLYQVVSGFGDSGESAKLLELSAKASAAGMSSTTDAVNLLSAVSKGYGDTSAKTVEKVSDLAFQTVKLGQTTFPELASSIGRVTPLAASVGVSMEELFGVMATGTGVTGTASEVSTQLRGILQSLMSPTEGMSGLLNKLGYESGAAMLQQLGLQGTIGKLVETSKATGTPLQEFIGSIEAQTLAMALAGPQATTFLEKLGAMGNVAGETGKAFDIQQATVSASMDRIKQSLSVVAVNLGEQFLPAIAKAGEWVAAHLPEIQAFFEKAFGAIGAAITWVMDNVVPLFAGSMESASGMASQAMQAFRDTVLPILEKLGPVFGKFVEVISLLWQEWGGTIIAVSKTAFETAWAVIGAALDVISGILDIFAGLFTGDWSRMAEGLKAIWGGLWDGVKALVAGAWDILKIVFGGLWDSISKWFSNLVGDATNWGTNMMKGFWDGITGWFGRISESVAKFAKGIGDKVKEVLDIHSPSGVFESIGANIGKGLVVGLEGSQGLVNRALGSLVPPTLTAPLRVAMDGGAALGSFGGQVAMRTNSGMGAQQMSPEGSLALNGFGGTEVNVFLGNRQLDDYWVEAKERNERRGRL